MCKSIKQKIYLQKSKKCLVYLRGNLNMNCLSQSQIMPLTIDVQIIAQSAFAKINTFIFIYMFLMFVQM